MFEVRITQLVDGEELISFVDDDRPVLSVSAYVWPRFVATSAVEYAEYAPQLPVTVSFFRARLAAGRIR